MAPRREASRAASSPILSRRAVALLSIFISLFLLYSIKQQLSTSYDLLYSAADESIRTITEANLQQQTTLEAFTSSTHTGSAGLANIKGTFEKPSAVVAQQVAQAQTQPAAATVAPTAQQPQKPVVVATPQQVQPAQPRPVQEKAHVATPQDGFTYPRPLQILPPGNPVSYTNLRVQTNFVGKHPQYPSSLKADDYKLTHERVAQFADDKKRIMVTWANRHYLDFVMNWVEHVTYAGITNFIVGAMDDSLLKELVARKIPCFAMNSGLTEHDLGWGSRNFHKMGREKIKLIYMFASLGYTSVISDVDTVWMRDPFPFFDSYPDADILTSSDHLRPTHDHDRDVEEPRAAGWSAYNIGIMYMKPTTVDLAREWNERLDKDANVWDQNAFNELFHRGINMNEASQQRNLFKGYDGKLTLGVLPVSVFCSGHTYFVSNYAGKFNLVPYVVHATFQFSGTEGKRHRFRERLMWFDPPEYYTGRFLYYEPKFDMDKIKAAVPTDMPVTPEKVIPHMNLMHEQMREIRSMYQIAQLTGRTLILPPIYCALDRWWAPHDGIIPGSGTQLPFVCPADHLFELPHFRELPEGSHGKNIPGFREYSFLMNPRTPREVVEDRVAVRACNKGDTACAGLPIPDKAKRVLVVDKGMDEGALAQALESTKDAKVLQLENPSEIFLLYKDANKLQQFQRRFLDLLAIWCCNRPEKPGRPGHLWYDPFFDISHRDRHNRLFDTVDPQTGYYWKPIQGP